MRVTHGLQYLGFQQNYRNNTTNLNDLLAQLSSGKKIQNSYENSSVYIDSMRLDSEENALTQIEEGTSKAQTFSNAADSVLNQFSTSMDTFKSKLIQAANGTQNETSLEAVAMELEKLKDHMAGLANSSINGHFLFSGTNLTTKPIDGSGNYHGNDKEMKTVTGADIEIPYNIDGKSLFIGQDSEYKKSLSTNVSFYNQTKLHPDIMTSTAKNDIPEEIYIKESDTLRDLAGDTDDDQTNDAPVHFYISGRQPNGDAFKEQIDLSSDKKVSDLIDQVGYAFGNSADSKVVNVVLNDYGQIEVTDLQKGNSNIDFKIIGAIDQDITDGTDHGDINNYGTKTLDNLDQPNVKIISFVKSNFSKTEPAASEGLLYDKFYFKKDGDTLNANVSQILKKDVLDSSNNIREAKNSYAANSTKILDTSGVSSLNGSNFEMKIKDINGTDHTVALNLTNSSSFTIDGTTYDIYNANDNPAPSTTDADEMTYKQLNDIIAMTLSGELPAGGSKAQYDDAIVRAQEKIEVNMDYRGAIEIKDKTNMQSNIEFSLYDQDSNDFSNTNGSALSFMSNNAITTDQPSVDIFKDLEEMIQAVKNGTINLDSNSDKPRDMGIQNALKRIDHISDHINKKHTTIGSFSQALQNSHEKANYLKLNITQIKSEVSDADYAETLIKFNQVNMSYQALFSSISKVNSLSLLNYMK